jgi:hypothetical protein
MDDAGTVFNGDIIGAGHIKCFFINLHKRHELFIFDVFQILALHFGQNGVGVGSQDLVRKSLCNIIVLSILFRFDIIDISANG